MVSLRRVRVASIICPLLEGRIGTDLVVPSRVDKPVDHETVLWNFCVIRCRRRLNIRTHTSRQRDSLENGGTPRQYLHFQLWANSICCSRVS